MIYKIINTLRYEGTTAIVNKTKRRLIYNWLRFKYRENKYEHKWEELKGIYKGKRVFLIGNGPSLNRVPLYYLKNEYTMCFNHFYIMSERLNWDPYFYLATDDLVLDDIVSKLDFIKKKASYMFLPDIHFRGKTYFDKIGHLINNIYWIKQKHGKGFSVKMPDTYLGGSVIYEGMQILNYLGFKEIYMIGVDMNFHIHSTAKYTSGKQTDVISQMDDDPNHFDPRYFGKDKKYHQPKKYVIQAIMNSLEYISKEMHKYNLKIINAGYDSKVEYFPKVDFNTLFNFSGEHKLQLVNECIRKNTKYGSVDEFLLNCVKLESANEYNFNIGDFCIDLDDGVKVIKKAIFTHIPIGPYDNLYCFAKRDL